MAASSSLPLPTIQTTEVDGVPVLWSEAPGDPVFALQFRVGRAAERPADGGITHIIEHLVMSTLGDPRYDHNAFVEPARTVFFASGTWPELTAFSGGVTGALDRLPLDRLDRERQVLSREAEGRGQGVHEVHAQFRFGFAGFGLTSAPEFGLTRATADDVGAWAAERFQRADAAAFLTAAPPADFRLPLRDGAVHAIPEVTTVPDLRLPSHVVDGGGGVALGGLVRRLPGAAAFVSILHRRLRGRLRHEHGLMYEIVADYTPLDATWATALVGGECDGEHAQQVTDIVFEELERFVRGDVSQAEIDEETEDYRRSMSDPVAVAGILDSMVHDRLVGMPFRQPAERLEEQRATTPDDLMARAVEMRRSALLLSDAEDHPDDVSPYPLSSTAAVAGREIKPILSVLGFGPKHRLIVGPEGITVRNKDGQIVTVRYEDCLVLEDPGKDGVVLWARDATRLWFPTGFWRDSDAVLAEIKAAIPADRHVHGTFSRDYFEG